MRCLGFRGPDVVQRGSWYRGLRKRSPSGGGPLSDLIGLIYQDQKGWRQERSSRSHFPPGVGEGADRERGEEAVQFGGFWLFPIRIRVCLKRATANTVQ